MSTEIGQITIKVDCCNQESCSADWVIYEPSFQGMGANPVAGNFEYMILGKMMFFRGVVTTGDDSHLDANQVRVSLPFAARSSLNAHEQAGSWEFTNAAGPSSQTSVLVMAPDRDYLTFSRQGNSNNPTQELNGNQILPPNALVGIKASIPIN